MGKNNYTDYMSLFSTGYINDFFHNMFAEMDKQRHREKLKNAGVEFSDEANFFGVPSKNIPFQYIGVDFIHDKFYVCYVKMDIEDDFQMVDVYKESGALMFTVEEKSFQYLGADDLFLIKEKEQDRYKIYGFCGTLLTENLFRPQFGRKFSENSEFCILGYKDYSGECVINKKGEVVFEKSNYNNLYLHGNIVFDGKHYINLFTGQPICETGYRNTLKTGNLMFVESNEQVYKIDTQTGEFEVFGEPKKSPIINDTPIVSGSDVTVGKVLPKVIKQGRNDICNCGSGLKYKKCCGKS